MKKKFISTFLALAMMLSLLPATALAVDTSGKCGKNLTWTLDGAGTLTIKGTGPMFDYGYNSQPWKDSRYDGIKKVVIQNGVTSIGGYAFCSCYNLTDVSIPTGVTMIGDVAFAYCRSLTSINIPSSVTSIGQQAFSNCSLLTDVSIPSSANVIGGFAFSDCRSLININIPSSVNFIGNHAFSGCTSLKNISIPSGITSIDTELFSGCSNLRSVEIPKSVITIWNSAFYACNELSDIYYTGTKDRWEQIRIQEDGNTQLLSANIHYNSPGTTPVKKYTVTFDGNGMTMPSGSRTMKVENGEEYGTLPTPTRTGYIFNGWCTERTGGMRIFPDTIVNLTADQTLYAQWYKSYIYFTVTFDANGGEVSPRFRNCMDNDAIGTLPIPVRNGYKFVGWYTSRTGGTKVAETKKVTKDMTLYAHWTKTTTQYTITLNANGGKVSPSSVKADKNATYLSKLPTPTRDGYKFDGWYTTRSGGTKITSTTKATGSRTIYAHWTKLSEDTGEVSLIRVTFNANGGTVSQKAKLVVSTSKYRELPTPTRPGQHFIGWYTARTGGNKVTEKTRVTATTDQTLYAHWSTKAVSATTNKTGKWTVSIPAKYRVAMYANATTNKISTTIPGVSTFRDVPCTKLAELSNGTVRYYGTISGRTGWFTYSCEMDVD